MFKFNDMQIWVESYQTQFYSQFVKMTFLKKKRKKFGALWAPSYSLRYVLPSSPIYTYAEEPLEWFQDTC